jgi:hypothetical protein
MESNLINMIPEGKAKVYHVSQNDENREIGCDLHDGPLSVTLDGSEAIVLHYRKPNGNFSSVPLENPGSGSSVTVVIPADMTDTVGAVYCKLRIDGLGAKSFFVVVERKT